MLMSLDFTGFLLQGIIGFCLHGHMGDGLKDESGDSYLNQEGDRGCPLATDKTEVTEHVLCFRVLSKKSKATQKIPVPRLPRYTASSREPKRTASL